MSRPLACFLSKLRTDLSATDVRIVVDNPAAPAQEDPGSRVRHGLGRRGEEVGWDSQRANRWQTELSSAPRLLEQAVQPLAARLGPTMPTRRRSLDESDDRFCQAIRECTIRGDQRIMRMPQRVCSSELTAEALFPDKITPHNSSPFERSDRACHTGWQ